MSASTDRDRRPAVPTITYPPELPVSARRDDLLAAIRDHQVVVVAGETGSGKTTQLPKICLELGRGVDGMIGHTQPRRLAARTVAERIAEELGVELGGCRRLRGAVRRPVLAARHRACGVMTDGLLLAEIQRDRLLRRYDTIIIDEAHERSLNIDFLLGYLRRILPERPDLKLIITSATIDPQRFARHFGDAPVVEVSGRTYPVEVRYRPLVEPVPGGEEGETVERDQIDGDRRRGRGAAARPTAATCSCSSAASARSATPPRRCAAGWATTSRCSRCTRGCRRPTSSGSSARTTAAGSCWRRTWPRRR